MNITSLEDIKNLNVKQLRAIDPEKINLGTDLQDCALIAQTYERAAHATASEAATFAVLSRNVQNSIAFAKASIPTLNSYLQIPQEDSSTAIEQAQAFASDAAPELQASGTSTRTDHAYQGLRLNESTQHTTFGESFGKNLLDYAKDCIPCGLRVISFMEMHPNIDLLGALEADVLRRLKLLQDVVGLLTNFDQYNDFCELMGLLSFMCIPDLQRIIALLMSLLMLELPELDGLIGMLQALIMPIFSPILTAITSLLDQFTILVTNPLECVIDAINEQLSKLGFELDPTSPVEQATQGLSAGLSELNDLIADGKRKIEEKLDFYIGEIKAMLGELGAGDGAYVLASLRKLKIVRFIAFISALIKAMTQGQIACNNAGQAPGLSEIDNFFNNYVNPNSPFQAYIDPDGNLVIDEKQPLQPPELLPSDQEVFEYQGNPLLEQTVRQTAELLSQQVQVIIPCKLKTTPEDVERVNRYIQELNEL